jgi:DNA-directed RNA polymerase subunit RPC12/RpoP
MNDNSYKDIHADRKVPKGLEVLSNVCKCSKCKRYNTIYIKTLYMNCKFCGNPILLRKI